MEKFKKDLAFLCFSRGVTLEDLKMCVESWGKGGVEQNIPDIFAVEKGRQIIYPKTSYSRSYVRPIYIANSFEG